MSVKKLIKVIYLFAILFSFYSTPLVAETIQLKNGKVFEGEVIERTDSNIRIETEEGLFSVPIKMVAMNAPKKEGEKNAVNVEIYVTTWCPHCRHVEKFLKSHNIPYRKYDIEHNLLAQRRFVEMGGVGVPLTVVGDHKISGYNPQAIINTYNRLSR